MSEEVRHVRGTATPPPTSAEVGSTAWGWTRVLGILMARAYRAMLLTLVAISVIPMLWGWGTFLVRSGSMEPGISVGDIALTQDIGTESKLPVGRVMLFENPAKDDGELLLHRVVERRDDGLFTTAGDANDLTDSTPVAREAFTRQAVLLVPYVGKPVHWPQTGDFLRLFGWLVLTMGAFRLASRRLVDDDLDEIEDDADDETGSGADVVRLPPLLPRRSPGRHASPSRAPGVARGAAVGAVVVTALAVTAGSIPTASAAFTARTRDSGNSFTVAPGLLQTYPAAVKADGPEFLWLLDATGGVVASDWSGNNRLGTYYGIDAYGQPGALPNNPGSSVLLGGGSDRIVEDGNARWAPSSFTAELWLKTTDTGKLIGFENSRDTTSSRYDRTLHLDPNGRLVYGAWDPYAIQVVRSTKAYNDGAWHHVAVSVSTQSVLGVPFQSTARIYADGVKVAEGGVTLPEGYLGWWRVGYGSMPTGTGFPTPSIAMNVDAVAVYNQALSQDDIVDHWNKR
ncbi:signal peptidase I [Nocardioides sp. MAH-18]|uniref:Signal peptidase I n=1 Tax=Nocardioides agri TaxID=2682843 RepID=A0A6L6XTM5_9ACTN|nr:MULTISPECIES: signal peptidase I [unclassified Nocardioides]MBA2955699.1 signal peptidase I [Nocardioides sp. CGMCC 1.13656]MVQ50549.1 signal peptidase I [Nocardioides sp. MAH-18]